MNTMRDQHECYQHHREGKCAAGEIGVVLAGWLAGRFSRARHMTSFASQEIIQDATNIRGNRRRFRDDLRLKQGVGKEKPGPRALSYALRASSR
jgi:hypothetical protein